MPSVSLRNIALILYFAGALLLFSCEPAHAEPEYPEGYIQALTIAMEAQGESFEGQVAVGEVIRTRAARMTLQTGDSSDFDYICLAWYQFSCWNGKTPQMAQKEVSGEAYQRAMKAWEASKGSNLTRGATMYANLSLCKPKWNWSKLERVGKLGEHTFWREKA